MKYNPTSSQIAKHFSIRPKNIVPVKSGVYRLTVRSGKQYCLKHMHYPVKELRWIDLAINRLRNRGFQSIAWRRPGTVWGKKPFARLDRCSKQYIVTPWLEGTRPDPSMPKDMAKCARFLAEFHRASRALELPRMKPRNTLGQWPSLLSAQARLLRREVSRLDRSKYSDKVIELLSENGSDWITRAQRALNTLKNSEYESLCRRSVQSACLIHGDSGPDNMVFTKNGPAFIDMETLRIDLRVYDLFRLIRLAFKKTGWNPDIVRAVLNGYRSVDRLEPYEYDLLGVWFEFPYKVCKLLAGCDKSSSLRKRSVESRLIRELESEQNLPELLQLLQDEKARGERDESSRSDE